MKESCLQAMEEVDTNGREVKEIPCRKGQGLRLSYRTYRFFKPQCRLSLFDHVRLVCIHKGDGLYIAEANTLRISVTEITFKILTVNDIKTHRAERTDVNAGTAANAYIVIHHHAAQLLIT